MIFVTVVLLLFYSATQKTSGKQTSNKYTVEKQGRLQKQRKNLGRMGSGQQKPKMVLGPADPHVVKDEEKLQKLYLSKNKLQSE